MYRILPSKHPSPYKRPPPIFDDPMVCVYTGMRYTNKWLLRVSAHPRFLAVNFKRPWALTRETTVLCGSGGYRLSCAKSLCMGCPLKTQETNKLKENQKIQI